MAKEKDKKPEQRRFEEKDRKPWTEDQRKKFLETADKLAPLIRHLTTPAKTAEEKDWLEELVG